ncbi:MAG: uracil-DNA glycosylase [Candidatus Hodarchaeaceae archaeon]|nr:uracil-DNA glycosylase [Candidatus Hodarchaeaceae archaeon]
MHMSKEEKLRQLEAEAKACKRCRLHKTRTNVVFGSGPADAEIMLLGEGPGFMEDKSGAPFVGAAGKNLDSLLQTAGLKREDVYITNIVLCRPPQNRDPLPDEIESCKCFLEGHISVIKPKFIITLGRVAARTLLGRYVTMGREHGKLLDCTYAGTDFKLYLTYHPAAALYGAEAKQRLQADFKKLGQRIKSIR